MTPITALLIALLAAASLAAVVRLAGPGCPHNSKSEPSGGSLRSGHRKGGTGDDPARSVTH